MIIDSCEMFWQSFYWTKSLNLVAQTLFQVCMKNCMSYTHYRGISLLSHAYKMYAEVIERMALLQSLEEQIAIEKN